MFSVGKLDCLLELVDVHSFNRIMWYGKGTVNETSLVYPPEYQFVDAIKWSERKKKKSGGDWVVFCFPFHMWVISCGVYKRK